MQRREFLTYAGATSLATGLAGCPAPGTDEGTEPELGTPEETTEDPEETTDEMTEMTEETTGETPDTTEETTAEAGETTETEAGGTTTEAATDGEVTEVAVGPDLRLRFDPEEVEIGVGDTVRWTFESAGHNVTTKPGSSERVSIPEEAEPFASYEGERHFAINEVGTTYEHTFTVPGEYVYVCAPHDDEGMIGTVVVAE